MNATGRPPNGPAFVDDYRTWSVQMKFNLHAIKASDLRVHLQG
jgi:hypothetical protein